MIFVQETFLSGSHLCDTKMLFFFSYLWFQPAIPAYPMTQRMENPQAPYSCDSGQLCSVVQGFGVRVKLQKEIRDYVETWRPKKQPYIGAWGRINGRIATERGRIRSWLDECHCKETSWEILCVIEKVHFKKVVCSDVSVVAGLPSVQNTSYFQQKIPTNISHDMGVSQISKF